MALTKEQNYRLASDTQKSIRPPLKWAGGKRWLLPRLRKIWQQHAEKRLIEPFCGGLAVTLGLRPKEAILNDINAHAVNFYRWLQNGLTVDIEMKNERDLYYCQRDKFNELIEHGQENSQEAAILFYYLNRTGYNGLCRFNKKGKFNVPFGRYASINYIDDFSEYIQVMKDWHLIIVTLPN